MVKKQLYIIHTLPYISRSKGNQVMKFRKLIQCNMRKIFLEKSFTKYGQETSPRPFSDKLKLSMSPDQYSKVLYWLFLLDTKLRAINIY